MIYAEIGYGNGSWISTEIEIGKRERRINRFIIKKMKSVYVRIWVYNFVLIIDNVEFIKIQKKNNINFKFVFGIQSFK